MKSSNTLQDHKQFMCHTTGTLTADDCYDDDDDRFKCLPMRTPPLQVTYSLLLLLFAPDLSARSVGVFVYPLQSPTLSYYFVQHVIL